MSSPETSRNTRVPGVFQFDGYRVELASRRLLSKENEEIFLRPKAFEMLLYLLRSGQRVVSKQDLLDRLWPDTAVEESVVPHCVSEIREALGDHASDPRFIQTIPKVGYIFIKEVQVTDAPRQSETVHTGTRGSSIAVLAFRDMSPKNDLGYLCEGLAEEIINSLAHLKNLRVAARTSAFCFKDRDVDVREIGRQLNVETVLEGSIRVLDGHLRIGVQLITTADGFHLWSDQLDFEMDSVFRIHNQITKQIVDKLKIEMIGDGATPSVPLGTADPEAYMLNLKGRHLMYRENVEDIRKAIGYLQQAVQQAPEYAGAYARLSSCHVLLAAWNASAPKEAFLEAKNSALRAVEADPQSGLTHEALAFVTLLSDWDWETAERASRRALELTPNSESAHTVRSTVLVAIGDLEGAISESAQAVELDPLSSLANRYHGVSLLRAGKLRQAIDQFKKALELEPSSIPTRWWLGQAYVIDSRHAEGVAEIQAALKDSKNNLLVLSGLGWAHAMSGRGREALRIVEQLKRRLDLEHPRPYLIAKVYAGLKENDHAFEWLEKAFVQHDCSLAYVKTDETLTNLHDDPRFADLLRRMGLEP